MKAVLVDTNVAVVANGRTTNAGAACTLKCIDRLERVKRKEVLLLDDQMLILTEYRRNLSPSGQPGPGDVFMKWVWDNQANTRHCRKISVRQRKNSEYFLEYPQDKELSGFDRSDRKFVAVALASKLDPPILNAVDTDWWDYQEPLRKHGVKIDFLCPEVMRRKRK